MLRQDQQTSDVKDTLAKEIHATLDNAAAEVIKLLDEMNKVSVSFDSKDKGKKQQKRKQVVESWQLEVDQMGEQLQPFISMMQSAPTNAQLASLLNYGNDVIGTVLDALETKVQRDYGITPVSVGAPSSGPNGSQGCGGALRENPWNGAMGDYSQQRGTASWAGMEPLHNVGSKEERAAVGNASGTPPRAQAAVDASLMRRQERREMWTTPKVKATARREDVMALPKTPRLEDFGLDDDMVRSLHQDDGLAAHGVAAGVGSGASRSALGSKDGVMDVGQWDGHDFKHDVEESMKKMGIERVQDIEERLVHRRHVALTDVMTSCTPKMKTRHGQRRYDTEGGDEDLDLSHLAGGYSNH